MESDKEDYYENDDCNSEDHDDNIVDDCENYPEIDDIKNTMNDINPFYISSANNFSKSTIITDHFKNMDGEKYMQSRRVLLMCTQDNMKSSDIIFEKKITSEQWEELYKTYCFVSCSMRILKTPEHANTAMIINKKYIEHFPHDQITLNDSEIVIPVLEISHSTAQTYASMFGEIYYDYKKLFDIVSIKKYFNSNLEISYAFVENILNDYYWKFNSSRTHELSICMDDILNKRKLHKGISIIAQQNIVAEYNFNNISGLCNFNGAIRREKEKTFYVNNFDFPVDNITCDMVTSLFSSANDTKTLYNLFNAFATSKRHCHLVINNADVLRIMKPVFKQYALNYTHLLAYPMLILNMTESMVMTHCKSDYNYIFTIDTAHELPVYPYTPTTKYMCPYLILPVSEKIMTDNIYGLKFIKGYKYYGIDNLDGFKKKLNIFTTGKSDINMFDGVDMKNLALTGSIISACVPTRSPLVDTVALPTDTYDVQFSKFFDKFYGTSDIDIVCTHTDGDAFINTSNVTIEKIKENVVKYGCKTTYEINAAKHARIYIDKNKFIELIDPIIKINPNIVNDKNIYCNAEVKKYFYDKYVKIKIDLITKKFGNTKYENILQETYYTPCSINDFSVVVYKRNFKEFTDDYLFREYELDPSNNKMDQHKICIVSYEDSCRFQFKINNAPDSPVKFRSFEIFKSRDNGIAFSTIARFHLPIVRGYYDGQTVRLLPSCVMAHLSYMNLDYNYVTGSQNPCDIIYKYQTRGYGILLNTTELLDYTNYYYKMPPVTEKKLGQTECQKELSQPIFSPTIMTDQKYVDNISDVLEELGFGEHQDRHLELDNMLKLTSAITNNGTIRQFNNKICSDFWTITNDILYGKQYKK